LPAFHERLSADAREALAELGVEVRVSAPVTGCDDAGVWIGRERIDARTIVWAAGVRASPAAKWLQAECDRVGRVLVTPSLSLPEEPDIFVLGDTAHVPDATGAPLPGIAPVAKQQGKYVARLIRARLEERGQPPFRYRDLGSMATIGRKRAVAQLGRLRLRGLPAWLLWSIAHVYFLIGFRNRTVVAMSWAWNYVTFERGTRLITGAETEAPPPTSTKLRPAYPE
jgi:NADH dehydrogenase